MRAEKTITIHADTRHLWRVLTHAEFTQKYMFNCAVNSTWEKGSAITWKGNYQGYEAFQKGEIIEIEPYQLIKYSTFDPNFGLKDTAENYIHVSYHLKRQGNHTTVLTIINETFDGNKKRMEHINQGWEMVVEKLKETAETY